VVLSQLYLDTMRTKQLLENVQVIAQRGCRDLDISGIVSDSRRVHKNDLFVALPGEHQDGADYIDEALRRGAIAIASEKKMPRLPGVGWVQVADARRALAELSCAFFEEPSSYLQTIGITGTNGKTTTSFIVKAIMEAAGRVPGLIGTVQYEIGERVIPATRTTPEAPELQALLRQMLVAGCQSAVMEVSSHALAQQRVWGIDFDVGVFTNLTNEHLDYHKEMDRYFAAKSKLFSGLGHRKKRGVAVINLDDEWGRRLCDGHHLHVQEITYGFSSDAQVRAEHVNIDENGSTFDLCTPWGDEQVVLPLMGRFNISNALAACASCGALGIDPALMVDVLSRMESVPGRLEEIQNNQGIKVFVDYAHTPDALKNVLTTLRDCTDGRIIVAFGCGGDRSRDKRSMMGTMAAHMADHSIITTDNARTEDPEEIAAEVLAGFGEGMSVEVILDRREAIARAIELAKPGDLVLLAGKGHENYQIMGHTVSPFDDREEARSVLRN